MFTDQDRLEAGLPRNSHSWASALGALLLVVAFLVGTIILCYYPHYGPLQ